MSNKFHDHLDVCARCMSEPFNLCPVGAAALGDAVHSAPKLRRGAPDWDATIPWNEPLPPQPKPAEEGDEGEAGQNDRDPR